jgi:hypothetical protein
MTPFSSSFRYSFFNPSRCSFPHSRTGLVRRRAFFSSSRVAFVAADLQVGCFSRQLAARNLSRVSRQVGSFSSRSAGLQPGSSVAQALLPVCDAFRTSTNPLVTKLSAIAARNLSRVSRELNSFLFDLVAQPFLPVLFLSERFAIT